MALTRWTHSCVTIDDGFGVVVVDPGIWSEPQALLGADAVLITHEHSDHANRLGSRLGDLDPELVTQERLHTGAVLLQAGPSLSEYGRDRMVALFRCVAPALPPGTPMRLPSYPGLPVLRLIHEDAASVP